MVGLVCIIVSRIMDTLTFLCFSQMFMSTLLDRVQLVLLFHRLWAKCELKIDVE